MSSSLCKMRNVLYIYNITSNARTMTFTSDILEQWGCSKFAFQQIYWEIFSSDLLCYWNDAYHINRTFSTKSTFYDHRILYNYIPSYYLRSHNREYIQQTTKFQISIDFFSNTKPKYVIVRPALTEAHAWNATKLCNLFQCSETDNFLMEQRHRDGCSNWDDYSTQTSSSLRRTWHCNYAKCSLGQSSVETINFRGLYTVLNVADGEWAQLVTNYFE